MQPREEWIKSLKVGDTVCDCRHQHREIARIEDVNETKGSWALLPWAIAMFSLPLAAAVNKLTMKGAGKELYERVVYFHDGSKCNATECLDPIGPGCLHD